MLRQYIRNILTEHIFVQNAYTDAADVFEKHWHDEFIETIKKDDYSKTSEWLYNYFRQYMPSFAFRNLFAELIYNNLSDKDKRLIDSETKAHKNFSKMKHRNFYFMTHVSKRFKKLMPKLSDITWRFMNKEVETQLGPASKERTGRSQDEDEIQYNTAWTKRSSGWATRALLAKPNGIRSGNSVKLYVSYEYDAASLQDSIKKNGLEKTFEDIGTIIGYIFAYLYKIAYNLAHQKKFESRGFSIKVADFQEYSDLMDSVLNEKDNFVAHMKTQQDIKTYAAGILMHLDKINKGIEDLGFDIKMKVQTPSQRTAATGKTMGLFDTDKDDGPYHYVDAKTTGEFMKKAVDGNFKFEGSGSQMISKIMAHFIHKDTGDYGQYWARIIKNGETRLSSEVTQWFMSLLQKSFEKMRILEFDIDQNTGRVKTDEKGNPLIKMSVK